jgi:hypothetical protein
MRGISAWSKNKPLINAGAAAGTGVAATVEFARLSAQTPASAVAVLRKERRVDMVI